MEDTEVRAVQRNLRKSPLVDPEKVGGKGKGIWKVRPNLFPLQFRSLKQSTTMLSDLPKDLAEEVLSRLPVTSLRGVRATCKKWNTLSKNRSFTMKHIGEAKAAAKSKHRKEFQVVMMIQYRVCLFSVNLLNPSIDRIGKLISLDDEDRVDISKIFHCDGLLLCITKDRSRLVVWNPCSGQTRWIEPRNSYHMLLDRYALGYEGNNQNSLRSHKVLRFVDDYDEKLIREFEIYSLSSNSWNVVDVNPDWDIEFDQRGVSLKGNTYWYAQAKISDLPDFLICFDFTTEKFGPRLPLPFNAFYDTVTLSSVREKHLAVLFQQCGSPAYTVKIWISNKIEPNAVSWNKLFLAVDMKPLIGFKFLESGGSFFVDEKKKVAVVLDKDRSRRGPTRNIAYIIGKKGYFKRVDLGESIDAGCWPLVCSYVPSSVQIKQAAPRGNQNTP